MIEVFGENELIEEIKNSGVYIYGAGMVGELVADRLRAVENSLEGIVIEKFLVSQLMSDIVRLNGIDIIELQDIVDCNLNNYNLVVAIRENKQSELLKCIDEMGYTDRFNKIIVLSEKCINDLLKKQNSSMAKIRKRLDEIEMELIRTKAKPAINVSFHLTDECNLNCKGCWHFAPLAPKGETFADVFEFEKDIKRLAEIMQGEVTLISLFGGEPLLHKEAYKFPYVVKKYLPHTFIELLTNGILIPQQDEKFWKSCSDNDVLIEWTQYPVKEELNEQIRNKLDEKGVRYRVFSGSATKCLTHDVIDLQAIGQNGQRGRNDARYQFIHCFRAGDCVQLKNHRLYVCDKAANAHLFRDYFGLDIVCSDFDGIDLYKAKDKDEITRFLCNPIPFCRYCRVEKATEGHRWSVSERKIEEWI